MEIILGIIGFLLAASVAFYIPGRVLLGKIQVSTLVKIALAIVCGLVMWGWQGFVFGYIHLRNLSYLYLLIFLVIFFYKKYYKETITFSRKSFDWVACMLFGIGVVAQTIAYYRMGWMTSQGMILATHNVDDHIWHVSLINELVQRFPPNEPGIAGVVLKDYHYWFNLVTADLIRVFHLPIFTTQFIGMYILGSLLFGILGYAISQLIYPSKNFGRWLLFFLYFSGNAAGWVMLIMHHTFFWSLSSLINDATKLMDSPAYGYAMVIGFAAIFLLFSQKQLTKKSLFVIALLMSSLIEFKVYVGISWMIGFGAVAFISFLQRQYKIGSSFILACILGLIIFLPTISHGGGLFFLPFETPRNFITQKIIGLFDWELRWYIYQNHHNIFRIIQYGVYMSLFYILIQFGTLLVGLIPLKKTLQVLQMKRSIFVYTTTIVAICLGLFFYQTVGGANIWEFFLAIFPLLGIVAALQTTLLLEKRNILLQCIIALVIIVLTIPQWFITTTDYIQKEYFSPFYGISTGEYASYQFLKEKTPQDSIVLVANQTHYVAYSSIVSVLTNRQLYLSGEGVRQQVTPVIAKRRADVTLLLKSTNAQEVMQMLHENHITYVYIYGDPQDVISVTLSKLSLKKVFENSSATIYNVN